jgi:threonine aldolase
MPEYIDLRSDTVTRPSAAMREAMSRAPVGDDVFGEDPSINALEEKAAAMLERQAAMFVPSGTMANQIAIRLLTRLGDEVLLEAGAHPYLYESGAAAVISSVQIHPLPGDRGLLDPETVKSAIRSENVHYAPATLLCLENTHNRGGGTVYPIDLFDKLTDVARDHSLAVHLDGARLFNACVASGIPAARYARQADTVSFCLSKGLGAPVGSLLVGDQDTIYQARRWRKMMGGGMRQAGILAAAGLYALEHNIERLADDHAHADILARGLADIDGLSIDPAHVDTNIVIFDIVKPGLTANELSSRTQEKGLLILPFGETRVRMVTHLDVDVEDVKRAVEILAVVTAT